MARIKSRTFVSFVLLLALCIPFLSLSNANSQSMATTTTTIKQLAIGQCSQTSLAFSEQAGKEVAGTFGSDVSINFYVLSEEDFDGIQAANCGLPAGARPLFIELNSVGHDNPYRSLPFPANGTYHFVFVYPNSGIAQLASGYATVELSYPSSIALVTSTVLSTLSSSNVVITSTASQPPPIATSITTPVPRPQQTGVSIPPPCCVILPAYVWASLLILIIAVVTAFLAIRYRRGRSISRRLTEPASVGQGQEVKYCGNCGSELAVNAKFCKKCGTAQ